MSDISLSTARWRERRLSGFTLVELLVVIAIIAILAGLTLAASGGLFKSAARNRAKSEIGAMSSALENYKTDNGVYPVGNAPGQTVSILVRPANGAYASTDPSLPGGNYQVSSQALYYALSGKINYADDPTKTPVGKSYMTFRTGQLGNYKTASGTGYSPTTSTYIQDPFGFSYGYSTGDGTAANPPNNGVGFYDLWSTGGTTGPTASIPNPTNTWLINWP